MSSMSPPHSGGGVHLASPSVGEGELVYIDHTVKSMPFHRKRHTPSEKMGFGSQSTRFRARTSKQVIPGIDVSGGFEGPMYHSALGGDDVGLGGYEGSGIWGAHSTPLRGSASTSRLGSSGFVPRLVPPPAQRMAELAGAGDEYNETRLRELTELRERLRPDSTSPGPGTYDVRGAARAAEEAKQLARHKAGGGRRIDISKIRHRVKERVLSKQRGPADLRPLPAGGARDTPGPGEYDVQAAERAAAARSRVRSTTMAGNTNHSREKPRAAVRAPSISTTLHWGRDWRTLMPFGSDQGVKRHPMRPHSVAGHVAAGDEPVWGLTPPPRPATSAAHHAHVPTPASAPHRGLHPGGHAAVSTYLSAYSASPAGKYKSRAASPGPAYDPRGRSRGPVVSFRKGSLRPNREVAGVVGEAGLHSRVNSAAPTPEPCSHSLHSAPSAPELGRWVRGGDDDGRALAAEFSAAASVGSSLGGGRGEAARLAGQAQATMRNQMEWQIRSHMVPAAV
mmetsp:Transcript_32177/g.102499  ORF Transcript_32177/g.102499 Transcript_32177/m.102499 type:complete len:507 (+) Transcript_32177:290-1810(+)